MGLVQRAVSLVLRNRAGNWRDPFPLTLGEREPVALDCKVVNGGMTICQR